jgi:ribosomal protein L37AE/L43A
MLPWGWSTSGLAHGRHIKYSAKRFCSKCKSTTDQICSRVSSRQSEESEDLDVLTRVWSCQTCGYSYDQVVEVPMPTEGGMIFRRLLKESSISQPWGHWETFYLKPADKQG